jgi:hypothetical protein
MVSSNPSRYVSFTARQIKIGLKFAFTVFARFDQASPSFHISGAGIFRTGYHIRLPQDGNKTIFLRGDSDDPNIESIPEEQIFVPWSSYQFAFYLHERCWQLMTRIVDKDLITHNLDLLLPTMHESKEGLSLWGRRPYQHREWFLFTVQVAQPYRTSLTQFLGFEGEGSDAFYPDYMGADPFNDPHVKLQISKERTKHENRTKRGKSRPQYLIPTHGMKRRSQIAFKFPKEFLPPEIVCMITDHLETKIDLWNFSTAFPQWHSLIPTNYWRQRFRDDNCLKNEELPPSDAVDWCHFYFSSDKLLERSLGWRNRQHILTRLRSVKVRFLKRVEEREKDLQDRRSQDPTL